MSKTKRIMVTLPGDVLSKLEIASDSSMRPLATEALYRIRLGLMVEERLFVDGERVDDKSLEELEGRFGSGDPISLPSEVKLSDGSDNTDIYEDIGSFCNRDFSGVELDPEWEGRIAREAKALALDAGVNVNLKQGYFYNEQGEKIASWK